MPAPRASKKEVLGQAAQREGHRYGAVRCPKCASSIEVVGWDLKLAEEFSVRCEGCHTRSFHTRTDMASGGSTVKASSG